MLLFPYRESFTVMEKVVAIGIRYFVWRMLLVKALLFGVISKGEPGLLLDTDQGGKSGSTGVVYPILFSPFGLPFAITNETTPFANIIIY